MIRNEQAKLTANYVNGLAIALYALGVFAPLFSVVYGTREASLRVVLAILICQIASVLLHFIARHVLRRLDNDDS